MSKTFALLILLLSTACANNMSQNSVNETERHISGGTYRSNTWTDEMIFKRISWFQELTMIYDAWFYPMPAESPFRQWFSKEELTEVGECRELLIVLHYHYDSKRISERMFKDEMNLNKYEEIYVPQMAKNMKLHPDMIKWRLQKHKVLTFCRKNLTDEPIVINFPNFKEKTIKL